MLCMSKFLFQVQEKNRLAQKGLLKRFSLNCMGHQMTIEEMRAEKAEKFIELKDKKNTEEYEEWFLRYRPMDNVKTDKPNKSDKYNNKPNKSDKYNNKTNNMKTKTRPKTRTRKHKKKKKGFFF
jgi:hypothetical protein